jgi:hypothetical protein
MRISEAVVFIAALSRSNHHWRDMRDDDLGATEADELMDEVDVSDELRDLVVADVVGGQYQCSDCFPDGCGTRAEAHGATEREIRLTSGEQTPIVWAGWVRKERYASDSWDQPRSRIDLIHEIADATQECER